MAQTTTSKNPLHLIAAAGLLIGFFLPWVNWEGSSLTGAALPGGEFFALSAEKYSLDNPYPQFSFSFYTFWLVPALSVLAAFLHIKGKKSALIAWIAAATALAEITVYITFSNTLLDLGVGKSLNEFLRPGIYISAVSAIVFAATATSGAWMPKLIWILIGPAISFGAYTWIKTSLEHATFDNTGNAKTDYTVNALELINEFVSNDSSSNKKYTDKILLVRGRVSELEAADSSINVKFTDSLSGSYAIFDFQPGDVAKAKKLNVGDSIAIKASCSGGIFSRLRQATVVSFKRATLSE